MDLNALVGTLLSSDAVAGVSQATGASDADVRGVLSAALPQLLSGAQAQADNAATAQGFLGALSQHAGDDTTDLAGFLQRVDAEDGGKIVGHLLGGQQTAATQAVAQRAGVSLQNTAQILATAAPLLMSLLGQQTGAAQSGASAAGISSLMGSLLGNVNVGSLLSGLLGGTAAETSGGKKKKPASGKKEEGGDLLGGLGGLLGGLLK